MNIKYLKKFRKRFSWEHTSGLYRLFDHKKKRVTYHIDLNGVLQTMIQASLGDEMLEHYRKKKIKVSESKDYYNALKCKNK